MDCFAALAMTLIELDMIFTLAARCVRGFAYYFTLLEYQRVQGKPGADRTRGRAHKAHE